MEIDHIGLVELHSKFVQVNHGGTKFLKVLVVEWGLTYQVSGFRVLCPLTAQR